MRIILPTLYLVSQNFMFYLMKIGFVFYSGGIARDWTGVPRMLFDNPHSKQYRCACLRPQSTEYKENRGVIREFKDCAPDSISCYIEVKDLS